MCYYSVITQLHYHRTIPWVLQLWSQEVRNMFQEGNVTAIIFCVSNPAFLQEIPLQSHAMVQAAIKRRAKCTSAGKLVGAALLTLYNCIFTVTLTLSWFLLLRLERLAVLYRSFTFKGIFTTPPVMDVTTEGFSTVTGQLCFLGKSPGWDGCRVSEKKPWTEALTLISFSAWWQHRPDLCTLEPFSFYSLHIQFAAQRLKVSQWKHFNYSCLCTTN